MPFIWGSGSTWKILIRSQNTTVKKANSPCTEDKVQTAYVICQRSPKGSGAKGHSADNSRVVSSHTSPQVTSQNHHITDSCPSHKGFAVTDCTAGHRGWRGFPMEGAHPAWGSCVNASSLNSTGLHRHNCSLKPNQTLAAVIKCCAWLAEISYSTKDLKSHFQPCLIT